MNRPVLRQLVKTAAILSLALVPFVASCDPDAKPATVRSAEGAALFAEGPADSAQLGACLTRTFVRGVTAGFGGGHYLQIRAHDSTTMYDSTALYTQGRFVGILVDSGGMGMPRYAVEPSDTACWWVGPGRGGVVSKFFGRKRTREFRVTVEYHARNHEHPDADWIVDDPLPSELRAATVGARPASPAARDLFLPRVAHAASLALAEENAGPWVTCTINGCCKPR